MLQIISGKFFGDGQVNEQEDQAILFSNYAWLPNHDITSDIVTLQSTSYSRSLTPYVLRYTNRYERSSDKDVLVMPGTTTIIEHARLLASFYFRALFNEDRAYIEHLTRNSSKHSTDNLVPQNFAPRWFDSSIRGDATEVSGFGAFVGDVIALRRRDYLVFMSCLEALVNALESISTNFDLAYSMLVYLLEALSSHLDEYTPSWDDFDQEQKGALDTALDSVDDRIAQQIRETLLQGRQLRLTRRFTQGIADLIDPSFYEAEAGSLDRPIPRSALQRALRNLYASRSQFVHALKKVHKQLTLPGMQKSDVFEWHHEPYFTLSGLIRLTTHVLRAFASARPKVDSEDYPEWRNELPGIIQAQLAPEYWVWQSEGLAPNHANKKFNGFIAHVSSGIGKQGFAFVNLKALLDGIKSIWPRCSTEQRISFYAVYVVYGRMVGPDSKPEAAGAFIESHWEAMSAKCSVQMMAACVLLKQDYLWKAEDCAAAFEMYSRHKYGRGAVNVAQVMELALRIEIANVFHREGDQPHFEEWSKLAIPEAAGNQDLQDRIRISVQSSTPIRGHQVLNPGE